MSGVEAPNFMTQDDKNDLIRRYAAGDISWSSLQEKGLENFADVLAGLGDLGLRQPVAPMTGPNVEARERACALVRKLLIEQAKP